MMSSPSVPTLYHGTLRSAQVPSRRLLHSAKTKLKIIESLLTDTVYCFSKRYQFGGTGSNVTAYPVGCRLDSHHRHYYVIKIRLG